MAVGDLEARLGRLEREARIWKIVGIAGLIVGASGPALATRGIQSFSTLKVGHLIVGELDAVNAKGKTVMTVRETNGRCVLSMYDAGKRGFDLYSRGLDLYGDSGKTSVSLYGGTGDLFLYGDSGKLGVSLDGDTGGLTLYNADGKKGAELSAALGGDLTLYAPWWDKKIAELSRGGNLYPGANRDGVGGELTLFDPSGSQRVSVGPTSLVVPSTGEQTQTAPSSITLFNASGSVIYRAPGY